MFATSYPEWYSLLVGILIDYAPFAAAIVLSLLSVPFLRSSNRWLFGVGVGVIAISWLSAIALYALFE